MYIDSNHRRKQRRSFVFILPPLFKCVHSTSTQVNLNYENRMDTKPTWLATMNSINLI